MQLIKWLIRQKRKLATQFQRRRTIDFHNKVEEVARLTKMRKIKVQVQDQEKVEEVLVMSRRGVVFALLEGQGLVVPDQTHKKERRIITKHQLWNVE